MSCSARAVQGFPLSRCPWLGAPLPPPRLQANTGKHVRTPPAGGGGLEVPIPPASYTCKGVLTDAHAKPWNYPSKHMQLSKEARILDPTQMASLTPDIASLPLIFSPHVHRTLLENGEWKVYRDSVMPSTPHFEILGWW